MIELSDGHIKMICTKCGNMLELGESQNHHCNPVSHEKPKDWSRG